MEFPEEVFFHIFLYLDVNTIFHHLLVCKSFSFLLDEKKMIPFFKPRLPHRVVDRYTLPQVVNLCRSPFHPCRMVVSDKGLYFLKGNRLYRRSSESRENGVEDMMTADVTAISDSYPPHVLEKTGFSSLSLGTGWNFPRSFSFIQACETKSGLFFLNNDGVVYRWETRDDRGILMVHSEYATLISYMTKDVDDELLLVGVGNHAWRIEGGIVEGKPIPPYSKKVADDAVLIMLGKCRIRVDDVEEVYYDEKKERVFLIKTNGKIRVAVKHRSRYIVAAEDYEHFSF